MDSETDSDEFYDAAGESPQKPATTPVSVPPTRPFPPPPKPPRTFTHDGGGELSPKPVDQSTAATKPDNVSVTADSPKDDSADEKAKQLEKNRRMKKLQALREQADNPSVETDAADEGVNDQTPDPDPSLQVTDPSLDVTDGGTESTSEVEKLNVAEPDIISSSKPRSLDSPLLSPSPPPEIVEIVKKPLQPVAPPRRKRQKKSDIQSAEVEAVIRPTDIDIPLQTDIPPLDLLTPNSAVETLTKELEYCLDLASATRGLNHVTADQNESSNTAPSSGDSELHKKVDSADPNPSRSLSDQEILEMWTIKNLDTGEAVPLSKAEEVLPKGTNPLDLHIMQLTNEYPSRDSKDLSETESSHPDTPTTPTSHTAKLKGKTKQIKNIIGKTVGKTVFKIKQKADEVFAGDDSLSSDDDIPQDGHSLKFKVSSSHKGPYAFENIKIVQDLSGEHTGAVWTMKFSHCGRLLATAGQDNILRVWVLKDAFNYFTDMRQKYSPVDNKVSPSNSHDSINTDGDDTNNTSTHDGSQKSIPPEAAIPMLGESDSKEAPFMPRPFCTYTGHTADLLDVAWSKNFFILSSSMDKTVRLWHVSRHECLCSFQHIDFVTAIAFHPRDDRYFLSGSLDGKLRLWNIPDKKVALWNEVDGPSKLITAANFVQNGLFALVGTYHGRLIFYDTEHLKYHTQIHVKSSRGKNTRGCKISGIEPLPGEDKVLVTSNDSRIRLYDLRDLSLCCKYKGLVNNSSQIKASFSSTGSYVTCGSEDHSIFLWKTYHDYAKFSSVRRDRNDFWESIKSHNAVVTAAIFAPKPSLILQCMETLSQNSDTQSCDDGGAHSGAAAAALDPLKYDRISLRSDRSDSFRSDKSDVKNEPDILVSADFHGIIKIHVNNASTP